MIDQRVASAPQVRWEPPVEPRVEDLPLLIHGMLNAHELAPPAPIGMMIAIEQPTRAVGRTAEATQ
jgi:hypothetical protein